MEINGKETEIDNGKGTAPVTLNSRTLLPVRSIIEAFDGDVFWDGKTQTVTLAMKDDTIKLNIGSDVAYCNGKAYTLDVAPAIINERTMLPIRFIAESFNLGVAWEDKTQTVSRAI